MLRRLRERLGGQPKDAGTTTNERGAEDWRLTGQQDYLSGRELRWAQWWTEKPSWDHDHCEFCFATIWDRPQDQTEFSHAFVTVDDEYSWICERCFKDFRATFGWRVVDSPSHP